MRPFKFLLLILLIVGVAAIELQAAVVLNPQGNGTAYVAFEGPATFSNPAAGFNLVLEDTLIFKDFLGPGSLVFDDVTFDNPGDTDFPGGFRWTERVYNNTIPNSTWIGFTLTLDDTPGLFFTDLPVFSPSLVQINGGGAINNAGPNTITKLNSGFTLTLSPDRKAISVLFDNPITFNNFFDIHAPIEGLGATTSFELTQTPILASVAVPLPSAAWATLSILGALAAGRRFRR